MKTITFPAYPVELTDKNWKASMDSGDKNTGVGELLRAAEQAYKKIKPAPYAEYARFAAGQARHQAAAKEFDTKFEAEISPLVRLLINIQGKTAAIKNPKPKTKAAADKINAAAKDLAADLIEISNSAKDNIRESTAQFAARKTALLRALAAGTAARHAAIDELNQNIAIATRMDDAAGNGFASMQQLEAFEARFQTLKDHVDDMLHKRHADGPVRSDIPESKDTATKPFANDGNEVADATDAYRKLFFSTINPLSKKLVKLMENISTALASARHQLTKDTEALEIQFATLFKNFKALEAAKMSVGKFDSIFELERTIAKIDPEAKARALSKCSNILDLEAANIPTTARTMKFTQTLMADITRRISANADRAIANQLAASRKKLDELTENFRAYVAACQKATAAFSRVKNS